jgi:hypothetical protein
MKTLKLFLLTGTVVLVTGQGLLGALQEATKYPNIDFILPIEIQDEYKFINGAWELIF